MKVVHRSNTENRMHHIFNEETDYYIKANFLYAGVVKPKKKWHEVSHVHDFNEILYIVEGKGAVYIEEERYEIKAGDLVIYNPGIRHYEESSESDPLKFNFVAFNLNVNNLLANDQPYVYETSFFSDSFNFYFEALLNEVATKNSYYKEVVNSLLSLTIVNVFRLVNYHLGVNDNLTKTSKIVHEAKTYIDKYFIEDLTIDDIANAIFVSNYYLIHLFKKETNITINEYIHKKRLTYSQELLKNSNFSVAEIAENSGYNSFNYFCRKFKKEFNLTPNEYRNLHNQ